MPIVVRPPEVKSVMPRFHSMVSVAMLLFCSTLAFGAEPPTAAARRAIVDRGVLEVQPLGVSFAIPRSWIEEQDELHNNYYLTPDALLKVREGRGEWEVEYAIVANAVLPFKDCVAHLGEEGWGRDGAGYLDVQMRVYVVDEKPDAIIARAKKEGKAAALRVGKHGVVDVGRFDAWDRIRIRYDVWYTDYGGTAKVVLFLRRIRDESLVLVFMYTDSPHKPTETITEIIDSVRIQGEAGPPVKKD